MRKGSIEKARKRCTNEGYDGGREQFKEKLVEKCVRVSDDKS